MRISINVELAMGHRLRFHEGKCRNYHGHNYGITVLVFGDVGIESGMVMDFGHLKKTVKKILDDYDHAMCLHMSDELVQYLHNRGLKTILLDCEPTAENLADLWAGEIQARMPVGTKVRVAVRETSDSEVMSSDTPRVVKRVTI